MASASSAGILSGFGTSITGFGALQLDTGAAWTISGNTTGLGSAGLGSAGLGSAGLGSIGGFTVKDTIDLTDFVAVSGTFANNVLVLTDAGSNHATLNIQGSFSSSDFQLLSDGATGTDIVVCFAAGTHIATPSGARRVEDLAIGDLVQAHFAGSAPIQWIGRRHVQLHAPP